MNRVVILVVVVCLGFVAFWAIKEHQSGSTLGNGTVTSRDGSAVGGEAPQGTGGGRVSNQPPESSKAQVAQSSSSEPVILPATSPTNATLQPAADTVAPNPPNGLAFGGTGRYQWYRQDNLTWRVDTQDGAACIAFATMEEWKKPLVYSHGCGNA
ncbi:hypothetical protein SAMN05421819_2469 [Bryocella elongata]|uniref:Uncharacterized protein n=1 Tax=Bryocella elongata TaxID=863522 RepID=A0A1H5Z4W3_9BACT|nr:hypothetical protein [Bryocella elongata]SEG31579.1 hypothetical protein SAMN05421819_2469 [Bryocella elongata]